MKWLAKAISWVVARYRSRPGRFLLITIAAVALATTGILWACGLFSTFSYLPNRAYIAAESEAPEPQTLNELLHSAVPDVDILLQKPALAQELLSTESLVELADSRLALNNLRTLDEELGKRLAELVPAEEEPGETPVDEAPSEEEPGETSTKEEAPKTAMKAQTAEQKSTVAPPPYNLENVAPYRSASAKEVAQQISDLAALKEKTGKLLTPPSYGEPVSLPQAVNLKGVWQAPGETLLHMTPSGDWLPEEGYRLFRVIDGKKELIAEQAASPANALSGKLAIAHADLIKDLYGEAALTPKKLETMGMTAAAFREIAYLTDTLEEKPLVSGALDFKEMQKALITIPAELEQKIPETDQMLSRPIYLPGQQNRSYANAAVGASLWKKLTVIQEELDFEINPLLLETLTARHKLTTLSFVDDEFAEEAGFLFRDDLSAFDLPTNTPISYLVEAPDGIKAELAITPGVENKPSKPQGLVGYGLDGKVPLRWGEVESEAEQDILSGYFIERKLDGEKEFVQINEEPVVVSYMLDETEIYFESPIFYEDEVADGRTAEYRLRSLDIFGRTSEYSDVLSIKVEKVSPPNAPTIATPALSLPGTEAAGEQSEAVKQSLALNKNKRGIVLPIHTDSPDTVRFTIYRAAAEGAKGFGAPIAIANLTYEHPAKEKGELKFSTDEIPAFKVKRTNRARHHFLSSIHPSEPNLVYFDSKIKEGYTYKYWVSAWDSWNNESVWSQSAASGVPTDAVPKAPGELEIAMLSRELPDLSELPPGVRDDGPVSYDSLKKLADGPMRQYETDITTIEKADSLDLRIGHFLAGSHLPVEISSHYDNLPGDKYIHMFVAVRGEEVLPNGTARLKWPHYSGEGLSGYVLYAPCFPLASLEEMQQMSRAELTEMGPWQRLNDEAIAENQFVAGGLSQTPGELSLFLVCLEPKSDLRPGDLQFQLSSGASLTKLSKSLSIDKQRLANMIALGGEIQTPESGYVKLDWKASDNPQVKYYRVYRFEVPSFKEGPPEPPSKFLQMWVRIKSFFTFWVKSEEPAKEPAQEWTLVGDNIIAPTYTERVEQSFAHYYYYKVTAVTPWSVESEVGTIEPFRVPSTKPPQTPNLLLPLSSKDGVRVNFSAVSHCDRYEIYRAEIPRVSEEELNELGDADTALFKVLFETPSKKDKYLTSALNTALKTNLAPVSPEKPLPAFGKINTLSQRSRTELAGKLTALGEQKGLLAYRNIIETLGPLALMDYGDLSLKMLKLVNWTKIGELPADYETVEAVHADTGLLEPLSFVDETAEYGTVYLYTVQAWNDDNLGSSRPEPVEATPRRKGPFDPISGLEGTIEKNRPHLTWDLPTMANLTWEQRRLDTAGYIVYRADSEEGTYYQASPLLFEPRWTDEQAHPGAFNWYKVKVLDTGGYLSEFSEPVLVHRDYILEMKPVIPTFPELTLAPKIAIEGTSFSIKEGTSFKKAYTLTGSEPITVTVKATGPDGKTAAGFSIDAAAGTVKAAKTLKAGTYSVTVTAKNSAGKDTAAFSLKVQAAAAPPKPKPVLEAPKLETRRDEYRFSMNRMFNFEMQLSATGSKPLTWSLEPVSERMTVPPQASIDENGLLTINRFIPEGNYSFMVKVANEAGQDMTEINLQVKTMTIQKPGAAGFSGAAPARDSAALPSRQLPPVQQSAQVYRSDKLKCLNFSLTAVDLSCPSNLMPGLVGYAGTAKLRIGGKQVPVNIHGAIIGTEGTAEVLQRGTVYLEKPFEFPEIGLTLVSMELSPKDNKKLVSGCLKSTRSGESLVGDLFALEFVDAELQPEQIVISKNLPQIRYEQFCLNQTDRLTISLQPALTDFLLRLGGGSKVSMKSHLETLNNEGVDFSSRNLSFDLEGKMSGTLETTSSQSLQHLVPGGAALRIDDAVLVFVKGVPQSNSYLDGKLILPFEQAGLTGPGVPGVYVGGHPETNIADELLEKLLSGEPLDKAMQETLNNALIKFAETVQQNSLLVVPDDFALQDLCSYIPVRIDNWDGKGFMVESTTMTPTAVSERSLELEQQRKQAITVSPTTVSVDLDREDSFPVADSSDSGEGEIPRTPKETAEPFWVGVIVHGGTLALPPDFIQTKDGKAITFELAKGELIYDLNGFNYQTILYNDKGVPALFGPELGNFEVLVYDCLLDLYANRVNLEINAEAVVDLFLKNQVKVKLYTNKKDNEDGKKGEFLCSVAPVKLEDVIATGIDLEITGGWVRNEGMHLNGAFELRTTEITSAEPLAFSELLVPSDREKTSEAKYGSATLDRPVNVDFHGFTMEIRALDLEYMNELLDFWVQFTLHGATLLAENIPLSTDTADQVAIRCPTFPNKAQKPTVLYEESHAVLSATFDECIELTGVLIPQPLEGGGDGLIEYDTEELGLSFLNQLDSSPVQTEVRFGYDKKKERCYFAVGIGFYEVPIHFGVGSLKDFTGIVAYNMTIERDERGIFQFPGNVTQMKSFIKNLPVHRDEGTKFAAGLSGTLVVLELCEIRNLFFCFESGPLVNAGGEICLPLDVSAIVGGGDSDLYTAIGQVDIHYAHPERYFSFTMAFPEKNLLAVQVSGTLGLEYSPRFFTVHVGYPEMLRGNIGILGVNVGVDVGVRFRVDKDGDSLVEAKLKLDLEKQIDVYIVYLYGNLCAEAEGAYYFDIDQIELELYLRGGIKGGIVVSGDHFNIIAFHLDAMGALTAASPYKSWQLACSTRVSYHLNLYLFKVEGSVEAKFDTTIG